MDSLVSYNNTLHNTCTEKGKIDPSDESNHNK